MLINYADKAVIGLSAIPIMRELTLSNTQFGALGSAFFLLFSLSGIVVGFTANRVDSKSLLLVLALVWAVAQAPMAGTVSFTTLIVARVALGAGEGPAFPMALHAVYKWFDDKSRTVPTSIVACGAAFGAGIVAPLITAIIAHFGWHAAFATLSVASLVWAAVWWLFGAEGQIDRLASQKPAASITRSYRQLLLSRTAIGVFIGGFVAYWAITLNVVWLAAYLVKGAGFTPSEAGWIIVLPSFTQIVLAPSLGAWSEHLVQNGVTSRWARGIMGGCCLVTAGLAMALFPLTGLAILKIPLVALAFASGSVFFTLGSTVIAEISPPARRGAMLGITNSIHTLAGIAAPIFMGAIVDVASDPAAGFRTGFLIAGGFIAMGGVLVMAMVNPQSDLVRWESGAD
jgi:MFS family permease